MEAITERPPLNTMSDTKRSIRRGSLIENRAALGYYVDIYDIFYIISLSGI